MTKRNLNKIFKHKKKWGNSVLSINLKYWACDYCGIPIKDGKPFAVVQINGSVKAADANVFDTEECLKIHIMKKEANRVQ